jgi:hypothetical protein
MGILDDAIREHLDLKRRHGADPAEIERLERDAFGPIRSPAEQTGSAADEYVPLSHGALEGSYEDEIEFDEGHDGQWHPDAPESPMESFGDDEGSGDDDEIEDETSALAEDQLTQEHVIEPPPASEWDELDDDVDRSAELAGPAGSLGAPEQEPSSAAAHGADEVAGTPAARHEVAPSTFDRTGESQPVPTDTSREDDLLEETPEFLQDTPEHDRLWFEQAPPRDFDFGG